MADIESAIFIRPSKVPIQVVAAMRRSGEMAAGRDMTAAADYMGPGALEINRYKTEIRDMVRRRFPFGQRINNTLATGQPSRYFEQLAIPTAGFVDPRVLTATASQPQRVERPVMLKGLTAQINYGLFDVEVNQQQGQFAYLEAKDLTDTVDGTLKLHDQNLWQGNDTDLVLSTSVQYFGVSGQIFGGAAASLAAGGPGIVNILSASGTSIVDTIKTQVATMANRQDFETRPSAFYAAPLFLDAVDQEGKKFQLYFNQVEILPGVIVTAIPTQMGNLPLIGDPSITTWTNTTGLPGAKIYSGFIISEDMVEYHYLTDPLPRVFQLGLIGNLAAQYVIVKFGAPAVIGASYAHCAVTLYK
jgi:hypothetical protein